MFYAESIVQHTQLIKTIRRKIREKEDCEDDWRQLMLFIAGPFFGHCSMVYPPKLQQLRQKFINSWKRLFPVHRRYVQEKSEEVQQNQGIVA